MNHTFLCIEQTNITLIIKIIELTIPFLLGLFASFIIDSTRNKIKNKKNYKFIKTYLRNSILEILPFLKTDYETVKKKIELYPENYYNKNVISAHEGFNANILKSISPSDYYSAFKGDFILLNEIISMIEFISQDMPYNINNDYFQQLNNHLKEKQKTGDKEHIKGCEYCQQIRDVKLNVLEERIKEVKLLEQKIENFIKNN